MKVLKANQQQYKNLDSFKKENSQLKFNKDASDNWIVSKSVLNDKNFLEIKEQLLQLEEIEHNPVKIEIDETSI